MVIKSLSLLQVNVSTRTEARQLLTSSSLLLYIAKLEVSLLHAEREAIEALEACVALRVVYAP